MLLSDFNYKLPPELIAQYPSEKRDHSRLMVLNKATDSLEHKHFFDIVDYLKPGDCLVLNDSKVIKARLRGFKDTGAAVEILLLRRCEDDLWVAMIKPGRKLKPGSIICFDRNEQGFDNKKAAILRGSYAEILDYGQQGTRIIRFTHQGDFMSWLDAAGEMPLPPYIARKAETIDNTRYQTVYSKESGSAAAPTAGLHFTEVLLDKIQEMGVTTAKITLHVGPGTFQPVKSEDIDEHKMHSEDYHISAADADRINVCRANGGRIICVGTTAVRTLESASCNDHESETRAAAHVKSPEITAYDDKTLDSTQEGVTFVSNGRSGNLETTTHIKPPETVAYDACNHGTNVKSPDGETPFNETYVNNSCISFEKTKLNTRSNYRYQVKPGSDSTDIFIKPGYSFKMCDCLITNFHLPKSTLLMLVSAFYGRERLLEAYSEAVSNGYRFFSYGDAMLITT